MMQHSCFIKILGPHIYQRHVHDMKPEGIHWFPIRWKWFWRTSNTAPWKKPNMGDPNQQRESYLNSLAVHAAYAAARAATGCTKPACIVLIWFAFPRKCRYVPSSPRTLGLGFARCKFWTNLLNQGRNNKNQYPNIVSYPSWCWTEQCRFVHGLVEPASCGEIFGGNRDSGRIDGVGKSC